jgi:hypothetical protein
MGRFLDTIPPHWCISIDTTFNIANRTKDYSEGLQNIKSINTNTFILAINGTGQCCAYARSTNERDDDLRALLEKIRDRCDKLRAPYPRIVFVDNADEYVQRLVQSILGGECKIGQDIKHFVNRLVRCLNKENANYTPVCEALHRAFTTKPTPTIGRNLISRQQPGRVAGHMEIVQSIKDIRLGQVLNESLFRTERDANNNVINLFDKQWGICETKLQFVIEAFDDEGRYCFEAADGHLYLYRGTNKNESIHRRLNAIHPEKCGQPLSDAIIVAFLVQWNFRRCLHSEVTAMSTSQSGQATRGVSKFVRHGGVGMLGSLKVLCDIQSQLRPGQSCDFLPVISQSYSSASPNILSQNRPINAVRTRATNSMTSHGLPNYRNSEGMRKNARNEPPPILEGADAVLSTNIASMETVRVRVTRKQGRRASFSVEQLARIDTLSKMSKYNTSSKGTSWALMIDDLNTDELFINEPSEFMTPKCIRDNHKNNYGNAKRIRENPLSEATVVSNHNADRDDDNGDSEHNNLTPDVAQVIVRSPSISLPQYPADPAVEKLYLDLDTDFSKTCTALSISSKDITETKLFELAENDDSEYSSDEIILIRYVIMKLHDKIKTSGINEGVNWTKFYKVYHDRAKRWIMIKQRLAVESSEALLRLYDRKKSALIAKAKKIVYNM